MLYKPKPESSESGKTFLLMLLVVTPTLLIVFGATFDLGQVAAGVSIAQQAADLGATEAGKLVNVTTVGQRQEVVLLPEAADEAQWIADDVTGGGMRIDRVYIAEGGLVVVEGTVCIRTRFLEQFIGKQRACRRVMGMARAWRGIEPGYE